MGQYPIGAYHFEVGWGGTRVGFSEVSGLEIEHDVIEYREGASPEYGSQKIPGRPRYRNLVLERGMVPGDNEFFEWLRTIRLNEVERRDLTISLLNEEHSPAVVWRAKGAFPVRLSGPKLSATHSKVAIETLEVAHEGLVVETE